MGVFRSLAFAVVVAGGTAGALQALGASDLTTSAKPAVDPFLWLEDVHGPKALAWVRQQDNVTRDVLTRDPAYQGYYDSILETLDATDRIPLGTLNHGYVYNFWQDAGHAKGIWRRTTVGEYAKPAPAWETLLDLDALAAKEGENWVYKGADCAPSQNRCLVSLSRGGGDAVVVREFDLKTKSFTSDGFMLQEAKSDVAYVDDNTVLFGTDFGKGSLTTSGYPRIVKLWKRGEPVAGARTVYEGKADDVAVAPYVFRNADGNTALIVRAVSFFETEYHFVKPDGASLALALPLGVDIKGELKGNLIATLRDDWTVGGKTFGKGALVSIALKSLTAEKAAPAVALLYEPGPRASVEDVATGRDAVYAGIFENVTGAIHVFRPGKNSTWHESRLDLPANGTTSIVSADDYGSDAQVKFESFLTPSTLYAVDAGDKVTAIKSLPARFDATGLVSEQFQATSKDGTQIPYFVVRRADLKGPAPTILYGYGGFEVSMLPSYSPNSGRLWLTRGGVWVLANIRGGGEFGPAWHDAALKENRQKAFDDFAAVAADLEKRGITTPRQLGIMGGSNGGLLVGAVMTQHPELLGAVVCQVPLLDMIRYTRIGAGASWIGEYGDPDDPKMRAVLENYSPYQNVKKSGKYPPVFFVTATSDDRVTPVHARKMMARMQAQGHDVLYYENTDGGHAAAANHKQAAEMWALSYTYLKNRLGLSSATASGFSGTAPASR